MSVAEQSGVAEILEKATSGERITDEEAVELLRSRDLVAVGRAANEIRNRLHDPERVTFIIDRNLNYTNVCVTDCDFCAFYRRPGDRNEAYLLPKPVIFKKIEETLAIGGTGLLMQGGHHPDLGIDYYDGTAADYEAAIASGIWSLENYGPPPHHYPAGLERPSGLPALTERLLERGYDDDAVLGILGEAPKLDAAEAEQVAVRYVKRAKKMQVIVGVSAPGFATMRSLARASMDAGAAGVMIALQDTNPHGHVVEHAESLAAIRECVMRAAGQVRRHAVVERRSRRGDGRADGSP